MAQGASITINVPKGVKTRLAAAARSLTQMNTQLTGISQKMVAYKTAMQANGNATKAFNQSMARSAQGMQQYTVNAMQGSQATTQFARTLQTASGWLRQMSIGLYVVGGAATSIARPLIAISMILNTINQLPMELTTFQRWTNEVSAHFKWLGGRIKSILVSMGAWLKSAGRSMVAMAGRIPVLGTAMDWLNAKVTALNVNLSVLVTYITGGLALLVGAAYGAKKVAEKFEPISEHIQRAISVSSIAQEKFDALARSIFDIASALKVFSVKDVASMVERMAYAGAINEDFKETAKIIGQIAYVTDIEMAEITRDMARLTSQTGASFHDLANVILRTFAQASITYEETVDAFQQAGMLLREDLGVTIEEMGAIVVQLEKFGYTGTRAATALRSLAARSSELKEGLRGADDIFARLGVEDAVEAFQAGDKGLLRLIKDIGTAGAAYGHFVQIFNRRAGVAAGAVSEFADAHAEATDKIKNDTTDIIDMYEELINTQKGIKERAEAARSTATQEWAYRLRGVSKQVNLLKSYFWDIAGRLSYMVDWTMVFVNGLMTVGAALIYDLWKPIDWALHAVQGIVELLNMIPGLDLGIATKLDTFRSEMDESLETAVEEFSNAAAQGVKNIFADSDLDVAEQRARRQEILKKAQEDFEESLVDSIEALDKFTVSMQYENVKKIIDTAKEALAGLEGAVLQESQLRENIVEKLKRQIQMGQIDIKDAWNMMINQTMGVVAKFTRLQSSLTYLEEKFKDVREELDEMFGLSRSINRRQAATVQETGEQIGEVRGMGPTAEQEKSWELLGEKGRVKVREMYERASNIPGTIRDVLIKQFKKSGAIDAHAIMTEVLERVIPGLDIKKLVEETLRPAKEGRIETAGSSELSISQFGDTISFDQSSFPDPQSYETHISNAFPDPESYADKLSQGFEPHTKSINALIDFFKSGNEEGGLWAQWTKETIPGYITGLVTKELNWLFGRGIETQGPAAVSGGRPYEIEYVGTTKEGMTINVDYEGKPKAEITLPYEGFGPGTNIDLVVNRAIARAMAELKDKQEMNINELESKVQEEINEMRNKEEE